MPSYSLATGGGTSLPVDDTTALVRDPADNTKLARIDVGAVATGTTRVLTVPDHDVVLGSIDDTAGDGDTTKAYSADHLVDRILNAALPAVSPLLNQGLLVFSTNESAPSTVAGLVLELDADRITGIADTGNIVSPEWLDATANSHDHTQATGAEQPTLQTNEINGRSVVRFDDTDDSLDSGTKTPWLFMHDGSDWTMVVAFRIHAGAINTQMFWSTSVGATANVGTALFWNAATDAIECTVSRGTGGTVAFDGLSSASSVVADTWYIVTFRHKAGAAGDDFTFYINGGVDGGGDPTASFSVAAATLNGIVGRDLVGADMDINFLGIWNVALSTTDRQTVESWAADKLAIAGPTVTARDYDVSSVALDNLNAPMYAADTGIADVYAIAPSPAPTVYVAGLSYDILFANANTGACTVAVGNLGVQSIKLIDGNDPAANDILGSAVQTIKHDGTNFQLINPASTSGTLAVASGGTGATTAADARTNLGLVIGTDIQAFDDGLLSIAGLTTAADNMIYTTASDTYATTSLTAFARTVLDDATQGAAQTTLGVDPAGTDNSTDVTLAGTPDYITIVGQVITRNAVDLTTDITGILPGANGGTGNGFTAVTGPTTSLKTFTLPDASAAVLTDNADVTVAQGGTGRGTATAFAVLCGGTVATGAHQSIASVGTSGQVLTSNGAGVLPTFQSATTATTALDNLAAVAINTSLISDTDITDDLGTGDIRWRDIHAETLNAGLTAADTLKLRGRDVDGAAYVDILTITSANTVTADLSATVTIGGNAILDATSTVSALTTVGTIATGVWEATDVALAHGGTNASLTAAAGGAVYSTASALAITAAGTTGQVLTSAGAAAPAFETLSVLVSELANGTDGELITWDAAGVATTVGAGTAGQILVSAGAGAEPAFGSSLSANLDITKSLPTFALIDTAGGPVDIIMDANQAGAGAFNGRILSQWNGNIVAEIAFLTGADTVNKDEGQISFLTAPPGGGVVEAMKIDTAQRVLIGQPTGSPTFTLSLDDTLGIHEQAAADADVAAYGQWWVRDDVPNAPMFTDDAGTDFNLLSGGAAMFGDGSDGNVTISSNVTLTSDMYYDTLTVDITFTLDTAGFRVFCKTTAAVAGVISNSGPAGSTGTGGVAPTAQVLGGGSDGGNQNSNGAALSDGTGGTGGTGGGAGGTGGVITVPSEAQGGAGIIHTFPAAMTGLLVGAGGSTVFQGGSGGGGGNTSGGGGGAGAGIVTIAAPTITGAGSIEARGGAGAAGTASPGDGGGGGGGGVVMIITQSPTSITTDVTGGAAGAANGAGSAGAAGANGTAVLLVNTN